MDLPLYVLDDPKPERRRPADEEPRRRFLEAIELLAEGMPTGAGPFTSTVSVDVPAVARSDRSSLVLRRFLLVGPDEGEAKFDAWLDDGPAVRRAGSGTWTLVGPLPLDLDVVALVPRPPAPPLRRVEGRLRLWASPVAVPVVLEMTPWYCSRVAIELRPKDPTKKLAWLRRETYFRTSHSLLDALRVFSESPSDRVEGLREVGDQVRF